MNKNIQAFLGLIIIVLMATAIIIFFGKIWNQFKLLDPKVSIAILTLSTTIIVSTLTVVLGKYYDRKKEIETHYRDKKLEIYSDFLSKFFELFEAKETNTIEPNDELGSFIREWQRKMILWGGQDVVLTYIKWMTVLQQGEHTMRSFYLMEDFFRALRKDLGHKNNKLEKGTFIKLTIGTSAFSLDILKDNPDITLEELGRLEKEFQQKF